MCKLQRETWHIDLFLSLTSSFFLQRDLLRCCRLQHLRNKRVICYNNGLSRHNRFYVEIYHRKHRLAVVTLTSGKSISLFMPVEPLGRDAGSGGLIREEPFTSANISLFQACGTIERKRTSVKRRTIWLHPCNCMDGSIVEEETRRNGRER